MFVLVWSSRNDFPYFPLLLSLSLAGVFSKFQGEGPTKRSCERQIKKPVESTRLTRADICIFAHMYFPIHGHSLHSQLMPNTRPVLRILRLLLESQEWREKGIAAAPVAAAAPVPEASLGDLSSFINSFCRNGILGRRSINQTREKDRKKQRGFER